MWSMLTMGFLLGLASSLHCIGMCGPLALSLPLQGLPRGSRVWALSMYHGGRIACYMALGLLSGLLGRRVYMAGFQQTFSVVLGIGILGFVGCGFLFRKGLGPGMLRGLYGGLLQWMVKLWRSTSRWRFVLMGVGNGALPCGMVYMAAAGALSLRGPGEGLLFMALFGLGTLPALLVLSFWGQQLSPGWRRRLGKLMPVFVVCTAVLLILRGLNLGIPFVSPVLAGHPGQAIDCR